MIVIEKNLRQLWYAYNIVTLDQFYMLQIESVEHWLFTQLYLSLGWSDLHEIKQVFFLHLAVGTC